MNRAFIAVLSAAPGDRRDLFTSAAQRLGTDARNVEKDFWVCWTLDALFNGLPQGHPRLLFKGGTSLSKAFGLIARFSEDIDVTVFRDDLGQAASVADLEALSGKKRHARLDAIRGACQAYIAGSFRNAMAGLAARTLESAGLPPDSARIELDAEDPDGQTLLLWYPRVNAGHDNGYVRPAVRIESGAKSALDPRVAAVVTPYLAADLPDLDLRVANVTAIDPRRTFWDKVTILHGLRSWFDSRGGLRQEGQRISRHYYDVHQLLNAEVGRAAVSDLAMAADCVRHARMFFNRPDFHLARAAAGTFALAPAAGMLDPLRRDYEQMAAMIFNDVPAFDTVIASVVALEAEINAVPVAHTSVK